MRSLIMSTQLKILSICIWGFGSPAKCDFLLHELSRLNYNLFLLQETCVSCKQCADVIQKKRNGPANAFGLLELVNLVLLSSHRRIFLVNFPTFSMNPMEGFLVFCFLWTLINLIL